MLVEINHLGAIDHASIDVKPLTVFIGKNNTGKTWAATTICGIFDSVVHDQHTVALMGGKLEEEYPPIETAFNELMEWGSFKFDLIRFFEEYGLKYHQNICKYSDKWINISLGTRQPLFDDFTMQLVFSDEDLNSGKSILLDRKLESSLPPAPGKEGLIQVMKETGSPIIYFNFAPNRTPDELPPEKIRYLIYYYILDKLRWAICNNIAYLPAERTGLMALMDSLRVNAVKDYSKAQNIDQLEEDPFHFSIPALPIVDLIGTLSHLKIPDIFKRITSRRKIAGHEDIAELSGILEREVLGGQFELEVHENRLTQSWIYRDTQAKETKLEMSVTSSTVKDLAPLVLYLRYLLKPRDLLLIDEPEMNLHPENQARFMELLVMMVNAGINIIIVTHSPYMVHHLENLIKASGNTEIDRIMDRFYLNDKRAFISADKVSVYFFGEAGTRQINDEKGNIDLSTFSKVGEDLAEIYFDV